MNSPGVLQLLQQKKTRSIAGFMSRGIFYAVMQGDIKLDKKPKPNLVISLKVSWDIAVAQRQTGCATIGLHMVRILAIKENHVTAVIEL